MPPFPMTGPVGQPPGGAPGAGGGMPPMPSPQALQGAQAGPGQLGALLKSPMMSSQAGGVAPLMAMLAGVGLRDMLATISKFIKTSTTTGARVDKAQRLSPQAQMGPSDALAKSGIPPGVPAQQAGAMGGNPLAALAAQYVLSRMGGEQGGGAGGGMPMPPMGGM